MNNLFLRATIGTDYTVEERIVQVLFGYWIGFSDAKPVGLRLPVSVEREDILKVVAVVVHVLAGGYCPSVVIRPAIQSEPSAAEQASRELFRLLLYLKYLIFPRWRR
jgi:hypothetical protein